MAEIKDKLVTVESLKEVYDHISLEHLGLDADPEELNKMSGVVASTDEINCLSGVKTAIQNQIDDIASSVSVKVIPTWASLSVDEWQSTEGNALENYAPYFLVVTVDGVTTNNTVIVSYQHNSKDEYIDCDIDCFAQDENQLIFIADILPTSNIFVNVLILN